MGEKYDAVEKPFHYNQYEHEVIELTECLGFCLGNAVKYILRAPFKGREVEDLKKAKWYLERLVDQQVNLRDEILLADKHIDRLKALAETYDNETVSVLIDAAFDRDLEELTSVIGDLEMQIKDLEEVKEEDGLEKIIASRVAQDRRDFLRRAKESGGGKMDPADALEEILALKAKEEAEAQKHVDEVFGPGHYIKNLKKSFEVWAFKTHF